MNDEFERQVEREERSQTDPDPVEYEPEVPDADELLDRIKELVKKGNVTKIVIKKGDNVLVNFPLNVGIVGGLLGIAAAPWALVAAGIAAAGFSCKVELVKDDGEVVPVNGRTITDKARDMGKSAIDELKDAVDTLREQAADIEVEIREETEDAPWDVVPEAEDKSDE